MNNASKQFKSTKDTLTKLSNAYFKQHVQRPLPRYQNRTITKFSDIFENIVLLFVTSFQPYTLDRPCLVC